MILSKACFGYISMCYLYMLLNDGICEFGFLTFIFFYLIWRT